MRDDPDLAVIRIMCSGVYDFQILRMQTGLRLSANFRSKLGLNPKDPVKSAEEDADGFDDDEETPEKIEAKKIIEQLKDEYVRMCTGVAKNRTIPTEKGFKGGDLISTYAELELIDQYFEIEKQEKKMFRQLGKALEKLPIWNLYLKNVVGIGPAMGAVLVTYFDIYHAHHPTLFWAYAGLDVAPDGFGRSRRAEHLVERQYKARDGSIKTKMSVTYEPWLKARLFGAMGASFLRTANCPWHDVYTNYKHRLESSAGRRNLVTLAEYKKAHKAGDPNAKHMWPPLRIHLAAMRYMIKCFLAEFWREWRLLEDLPLNPYNPDSRTGTYAEDKLGMPPHGQASL
jgi:hypothetical protein